MAHYHVQISFSRHLQSRLEEALERSQIARLLNNLVPCDITVVGGMRPIFPHKEQIEYLESLGLVVRDRAPFTYRIYIGSEISEAKEQYEGVELPASILEDQDEFKRQILERVRKVVGKISDN